MAKNVSLLLIESVEDLGIVGDVVNVRTGYARNFLLPRGLATQPDEQLKAQLAGKRAQAEKLVAQLRKEREETTGRLKGVEVSLTRSCNDMGILYGAVTQQDIAKALNEAGYKIAPRDVRLSQTIKRIDSYDVHVKLASDLDATVKVKVVPDRELKLDRGGATTGAEGEEAGPVGAGADSGKKRDAISQALEAASRDAAKGTGWSKREEAGSEAPSPKGGKGDKPSKAQDKGEKKGDKGDAKDAKPAEKKADKADKPAKKDKK
jgi:large subunit ribosomal protein L9